MSAVTIPGCACCDRPAMTPKQAKEWDGRMDDFCLDCALARCDWRAGSCGKRPALHTKEEPDE